MTKHYYVGLSDDEIEIEIRGAARKELRLAQDELRDAAEAWLKFDNEVEQPDLYSPYDEMVAYETEKFAITERVAKAIKATR